jgi:hypothetical protein
MLVRWWTKNKHRENRVYVPISSAECMSKSLHKNSRQSFENVSWFRYFGMTVTNQNLI